MWNGLYDHESPVNVVMLTATLTSKTHGLRKPAHLKEAHLDRICSGWPFWTQPWSPSSVRFHHSPVGFRLTLLLRSGCLCHCRGQRWWLCRRRRHLQRWWWERSSRRFRKRAPNGEGKCRVLWRVGFGLFVTVVSFIFAKKGFFEKKFFEFLLKYIEINMIQDDQCYIQCIGNILLVS